MDPWRSPAGRTRQRGLWKGIWRSARPPWPPGSLPRRGNPLGTILREKFQFSDKRKWKEKTEKKKSYQPLSTTALPHRRFFYDYVLYMAKLMIAADKKIVSSVFFFSSFFNHSSHFLALANSVFLCFLFFKCCIPIRIDGKVVSSAFLCFLINILVCSMPERWYNNAWLCVEVCKLL